MILPSSVIIEGVPATPRLFPNMKCLLTGLSAQIFWGISLPSFKSVIAWLGSFEHQAEVIFSYDLELKPSLGKAK